MSEFYDVTRHKRRRSEGDKVYYRNGKAKFIEDGISRGTITRAEIRELALSEGGLLSNEYRKILWIRYLGIKNEIHGKEIDIKTFRDYSQVCLDVRRVNARIRKGSKKAEIAVLKENLKNVIVKSLSEGPTRHYYQGYHDVSLTMLYVLSEHLASQVMSRLCATHLSSHIRANLDETSNQMKLIIPLVSQRCPDLADFILRSDAGTMFSLSWIITWFSYVVSDENIIYRLYDVFITSPPLMAVYLSAAIVLYRKKEIISVECELSSVHHVLHAVPQDLPWEKLIWDAHELLRAYPENQLKTLPIKQKSIILNVPRSKYLDWSQNWASRLIELANTPAGIAIASSFIVGFGAFVLSVYTSNYRI